MPDRRQFLSTTAAALAGAALTQHAARAQAPAAEPSPQPARPVSGVVRVISSANGLECTKLAYQRILAGDDPLDAVVAGITLVEDDPEDDTVGYGGLPNEEGVVELDAAVMHGPTHRAGAVAALRNIKNPAQVAKLVMEQTDHVLIVGEGALRFAKAHGFKEQDLLTDHARKVWLYWKATLSDQDDWLPPPPEDLEPGFLEEYQRATGTIHCSAINAAGDLSCATSTSGLAFKIPGRVGDSPIIGAGLYLDNNVGSCGSTGRGEANLANCSSATAVELMRSGLSPKDAGLTVLRRIAENTVPRLRDADGRPDFNLKLYLMAKDGQYAGVSMWNGNQFSVTDERGTRLEDCVGLFERAKQTHAAQ